jgi:hypothetical protein
MLLKRMRRTTTAARKQLKELQEQHRELEEQMLAVFADVIDATIHTPPEEHATLGQGVRNILKDYGGAEALRERYEQVSAYHNNNYRPLMWGFYRPYRAELFRLSYLLTFRSATQDQSLIEVLHFIQRFQNARRDHLPDEISLDFASVRWQALVRTRHNMGMVLKRRQLEVCVFNYLDHGLRCGDIYVEGSDAHADYRQQLVPWDECIPRVPAYCQALQFASTASDFVAELRERLRDVSHRVDATYPENTELTISVAGDFVCPDLRTMRQKVAHGWTSVGMPGQPSTNLARMWQQHGRRQDAYDLLAPVYGWFPEGFDTADLKDGKALLEELA